MERKFCWFLVLILLSVSLGQVAFANDFYQNNNILYYNKDDCVTGSNLGSFDGNSTVGLSNEQAAFVDQWHQTAETLSIEYGIPWEAVMAQGILESDAGRSNFARERNNFFGIGAFDSNPDAAKRYSTPAEGWRGYYDNIVNTSTYRDHGVFVEPTITDPYAYIQAVKNAGYASDPDYVSKVSALITAVETRATEKGWESSAELAVSNPDMLANAAINATGSGSGSSSGAIEECIGDSRNMDAVSLQQDFANTNGKYGSYTVNSNGCTTVTAWFIGTRTTLNYGNGDGGDVATQLVAVNNGLQLSSQPRAPGIFSTRGLKWGAGQSTMCGSITCGHTGVVVAVNGDQVTILESWAGINNYSRIHTITWSEGDDVQFVYVGDYLK